MLAKPTATLPARSALPGGALYEPKWDGYWAILAREHDGCRVWSRRGAELARCFPDVAAAACEQLDPGTVIDGELVVWQNGRIEFTALTPRLAYRGSRRPPSGLAAASFLAFDLLAGAGGDLRNQPLSARREHLERMAASWRPPLQLTPQTADPLEAQQWFDNYAAADVGVEGIVVKGAAKRYLGGQ